MTAQDKKEFNLYLKTCTDSQVRGVPEKEMSAGRKDYAALAKAELERRNLI